MEFKMTHDQYNNLLKDPDRIALGEQGDCSVIALAFAGGISYRKAHEALKRAGRKNRQGASVWDHLMPALHYSGVTGKTVDAEYFCRRPWQKRPMAGRTTKAFKTGKYIGILNRHVYPIIDGWTPDRLGNGRSRVEMVLFIDSPVSCY